MIAFIIATPLQLFNCINIILSQNQKADIYVMDFAVGNLFDVAKKAKKINLVNDVFQLPHYNSIGGKLCVLKDYFIKSKKIFRKKKYDALYTTIVGDRQNIVYNELRKNNNDIKVYFYEEGIGIYRNCEQYFTITKKQNLLYHILGYVPVNNNLSGIYVYHPNMIETKLNVPIIKIPSAKRDNLQEVFNNNLKNYEQYDTIYFDTWFYSDKKDSMFEVFCNYNQSEILFTINNYLTCRKVLVRKHPRSIYSYPGFDIDCNTETWEGILANYSFDQYTFIALDSTATFSPKMIFDYEPRVILLGKYMKKLYSSDTNPIIQRRAKMMWSDAAEQLAYKVKNMYKDKSRFCIAENEQDIELFFNG